MPATSRIWPLLVACMLLSWLPGAPAHAAEPRTLGLVIDGLGYDQDGLKTELVRVLSADFDVSIPDDKVRVGGWSVPQLQVHLDSLLRDDEVDLIIAVGVLSSHVATRLHDPGTPVIATYVVDPVQQGLAGPRDPQIFWLQYPNTLDADLRTLHALVPFEHVAAIVHRPFLQVLPDLPDLPAARELGFDVTLVPVDGHPKAALEALPDDIDAVLVTPLPGVPLPAITELAQGLVARGLPSVSQSGRLEVEQGLLLGLNDGRQPQRQTRQAALVAQEVLLGRDPGGLMQVRVPATRVSINLATAEALGVVPGLDVLFDAEVFGQRTDALTLPAAVGEALAHHGGLAGARDRVTAGDEARARAWSAWLPHVTAHGSVEVIDAQRVDASVGTLARTTTTAGVTVEQLLFSDPALATLTSQDDADLGRQAALRTTEADLVLEVSVAWAQLQRSRARVAVHTSDVRQVEGHLAAHRARRAAGQASGAEQSRWEAALAQSQRRLVEARTLERRSALSLGRLLGRPVRSAVSAAPRDAAALATGLDDRVMQALFTADQAVSERVADALVAVGVDVSPELAELDTRIAVQQRTHDVARRAWGMPTVAAAATVAGIGRAGYDPFSLPGLPPRTFPRQPSGIWTVGAQASLPLFTGGARDADRREAAALLSALEHERRFAAEGIEQRVRDSLTAAAGSFASRQLASVAEAAALRNAEWASQAYAQGSLPQVGLIDARGAALDASLATADASFVLAIDLLHLQRAVLHQQAVLDDDEWATFVAEVVALLEAP